MAATSTKKRKHRARVPKRPRMYAFLIDLYNGLMNFCRLLEKRKTTRPAFDENYFNFSGLCTRKKVLQDRANERAEMRETKESWELCEMVCVKVFIKFFYEDHKVCSKRGIR